MISWHLRTGENRFALWRALNWPNRITLLRLALLPPFIVLLLRQPGESASRYAALGIFLLMALSDVLDGVLARRLRARTRLGAILDPLADKLMIISAAVLLSLPEYAPPGGRLPDWVVVAIVGKDLWVIVGFVVVYLVTDRFRIRPSFLGKACTVGQVIMVVSVLLAPEMNQVLAGLGSWMASVAGWAVAALCVLAIISYTRMGLSFVIEEAKPLENSKQEKRLDEPD